MGSKRVPARSRGRRNRSLWIAIVPDQRRDAIERRREIREAFHDSRALTIKTSLAENRCGITPTTAISTPLRVDILRGRSPLRPSCVLLRTALLMHLSLTLAFHCVSVQLDFVTRRTSVLPSRVTRRVRYSGRVSSVFLWRIPERCVMKTASVSPPLPLLAVLSLGLMLSQASGASAQGEVRVGTGTQPGEIDVQSRAAAAEADADVPIGRTTLDGPAARRRRVGNANQSRHEQSGHHVRRQGPPDGKYRLRHDCLEALYRQHV